VDVICSECVSPIKTVAFCWSNANQSTDIVNWLIFTASSRHSVRTTKMGEARIGPLADISSGPGDVRYVPDPVTV
jgi:hypothetical protein